MYLSKATLTSIKGMPKVEMSFRAQQESGWHVLLGDNGSGKSALIRALALCFVGPDDAAALREDWSRWITWGEDKAQIVAAIRVEQDWDRAAGSAGGYPKTLTATLNLELDPTPPGMTLPAWGGRRVTVSAPNRTILLRYLWGAGAGWFSSSFGPFRRFSGGNRDYDKLFYSNPRVARHLSAFSEEVALGESLEWLKRRKRDEDDDRTAAKILPQIIRFVNDTNMLPHDVTLDRVTPEDVIFSDGNGVEVQVLSLSDGYRSILSLTFELLRQVAVTYGEDKLFTETADAGPVIMVPGIVLIDEIDAHLHPSWQAVIGQWFKSRFPKIQFIVATHSPLVCRAVGEDDSIFRLHAPGSEQRAKNALVELDELERAKLRFGSIHKAYESEGFELQISRSPEAISLLRELSDLNKRAKVQTLSPAELVRRRRLQDILSDDERTDGEA